MPHAVRRRVARANRRPSSSIKPDPDSQSDSNSVPESSTVNFGLNQSNISNNSNYGGSSSYMPADPSIDRNGRSDAPTPSERLAEPEPLLREMRMRPNAAAESPSDPTDSFFQTSFQDIGKELKAYNDTLGELQQLGVSHDVQLPELVLIGDQSAGKSSLMSGLANLELPRSEGTCTRCPLHIRVSRNTEWSCRVWLRKEYSYQPPDGSITEADVTDEDPFFPWRKLPSTIVHEFKTMHDRSEIDMVLRWAQIAILNDDKNPKLFIPGSGALTQVPLARAAEEVTAKFSPNIVALEIKGPDLPDLSFYDMPGIFQNPADARDDYLVDVVRNLSKEYIQHPSAIIICSMPMNSDAENSSTFGLTRKLKALDRTIGVLTKADLLPDNGNSDHNGNHDQWLAIMKGEAHQTGLGYFITSRPQEQDLEKLKEWEDGMFKTFNLGAWPPAFHRFSHRCGVEKLKSFLSERLGEEFAKSLPFIKNKVKQHLQSIHMKLSKLPELPSNVELEVQESVRGFAELARMELKPGEFSKQLGSLPDDFRECLLDMKPKFVLRDNSDIPVLEISDDESDAGSTANNQVTPSKRRMGSHNTPSKRHRGEVTPNPVPFHIKPEEGRASLPPPPPPSPAKRPNHFPEPFTKFSDIGRGFRTLRQVRLEIQAKKRAGMPNLISEEIYNDLCREAIKPWDGPAKAFLNHVMRLIQSRLDSALKKAFDPLSKRLIFREARRYLRVYLEEQRKETEHALLAIYRVESYGVFTINLDAFKRCYDEEGTALSRFRHQMRVNAAMSHPDSRPLIPWENLTQEKRMLEEKRREQEIAKIGPDPFKEELEVVTYTRGYYRLAALRFADSVALHINNGMIPGLQAHLPYLLDEKLGLRGPDAASVYETLMAEDDSIADQRATLKLEKEKFEKALASIEALEAGDGQEFPESEDTAVDTTMSGTLDAGEA